MISGAWTIHLQTMDTSLRLFWIVMTATLVGCTKEDVPPTPTAPADLSQPVTDIDGNSYPTVLIGTQRWMAENLRVSRYRNGDPIPTGLSDADWSQTTSSYLGAYAVLHDADSNDVLRGKLYNGFAVNDQRGLCPAGWHIPTDEDWTEMELHLGMPTSELDSMDTFRGEDANTGGQLRDTTRWEFPDTAATNSTGFTAIPGGFRFSSGPYLGENTANFWTSTVATGGVFLNLRRSLVTASTGVLRAGLTRTHGLSCRCVED